MIDHLSVIVYHLHNTSCNQGRGGPCLHGMFQCLFSNYPLCMTPSKKNSVRARTRALPHVDARDHHVTPVLSMSTTVKSTNINRDSAYMCTQSPQRYRSTPRIRCQATTHHKAQDTSTSLRNSFTLLTIISKLAQCNLQYDARRFTVLVSLVLHRLLLGETCARDLIAIQRLPHSFASFILSNLCFPKHVSPSPSLILHFHDFRTWLARRHLNSRYRARSTSSVPSQRMSDPYMFQSYAGPLWLDTITR